MEESEYFKQLVIDRGRERGQRFAVLSIDLPGFGYSSRPDVDNLVRERTHGGFHGFRLPSGRDSNFPLLGFYRDLIVELSNVVGGLQHVMGGSLGGNLALWAAEKPNFSTLSPHADRLIGIHSIASWSPGSIWESYERSRDTLVEGNGTHVDIGKNGAKKRSLERMNRTETEAIRKTDFFELMQRGEELLGAHTLGAWGHPPTQGGMLTQTEFYSEAYRRVFWMAAYEQLTSRLPSVTKNRLLQPRSFEATSGHSNLSTVLFSSLLARTTPGPRAWRISTIRSSTLLIMRTCVMFRDDVC